MLGNTPTSCPLCLTPATVLGTTNAGRNRVFDCKDCRQFAVSEKADSRLRGLPDKFKDAWRAKIRSAKPDELLVMIVGPVGSGSQLEEEWVPRHTIQSLP